MGYRPLFGNKTGGKISNFTVFQERGLDHFLGLNIVYRVSLVVNIFNEKTVAVLQQNGFADTACFVRQVTKVWNILNVKSPKAAVRLNDPNRKPFSDKDDTRLQFLQSMATSFSEMNPRSVPGQMRKQMSTIDTSEALSLTLNGLVSLIQTLLDKGFSYVLPGQMQ